MQRLALVVAWLALVAHVIGCGARTGLREPGQARITYIKASNHSAPLDSLGFGALAVSADGATLAVGAPGDSAACAGIDGPQDPVVDSFGHGALSGALYVFGRSGTTWGQEHFIKPTFTPRGGDYGFGRFVAISADGSTLAVSASDYSLATGIDGDPNDIEFTPQAPEVGAVFVFRRTADSWRQEAYVKPSTTHRGGGMAGSQGFGGSLALSADGSTLAVGAPGEGSASRGVGGDETDISAPAAGAVYVFTRNGDTWAQQAYIKASNPHAGDEFANVALSYDGNTLAVGAVDESSGASGIDGDQTDTSAHWAGAVYVFTRAGTSWSQQAYIKASNAQPGAGFGEVALSADGATLVVGAAGESSAARGVGGDQSDTSAPGAGAVYVFRRRGSTWAQEAYLKATNTDAGDGFGARVALSPDGSRLYVSAIFEASSATGVDGDQTDNSIPGAGAVYEYRYSAGAWVPWAYIKAPNTALESPADAGPGYTPVQRFGIGLATDGLGLAAGASGEDSCATGVGGDQHNHGCRGAGAVYVYEFPP